MKEDQWLWKISVYIEPEVSETVAPISSSISKKVFITDVLGCFGEGSRAVWVSAISATFLSNTVLALALWVDPLKNLSLKRGSKIVARISGPLLYTSAYRLFKELSIIVCNSLSSLWFSKFFRRTLIKGMIKETEAASVEIDLVISSIGLRADMTLLTRSNWFDVSCEIRCISSKCHFLFLNCLQHIERGIPVGWFILLKAMLLKSKILLDFL